MYISSNLCVSSASSSRFEIPKLLVALAKNFVLLAAEEAREMEARVVYPPELPPRIAVRLVSMKERSSGDCTASMQSLTSVMPQFPLRRSLAASSVLLHVRDDDEYERTHKCVRSTKNHCS
jgi:hypothetical protein